MASAGMAVFVEMPNLSSASLLNLISTTCPFFETSRMTAFRNSKPLEKTDKLFFGEHLVVKYKYENLDRADTKTELEKILWKMKDIDESLQLLSTQNEDLVDKEQFNPNKGVYGSGVTELSGKVVLGKSDVVYYGERILVSVIRVKLPGSKTAVIAPGQDRESQGRFRRIAEADAQRIYFDEYREEHAIAPLEHMTKEEFEKEKGRLEKEYLEKKDGGEEFSSSEEESDESDTMDSFVLDEDIPQLSI
ncbi:uncharacterized protein DFL_009203 [Arthrobotrys flagrans]|uniref:Uncharacterized protein n=1 Tax=Arthrobotrys flagrans TaxID=97331 RepID=A0A436ZQZ7_ARTFL|nr:hypothetical protein DFL_009203 [Arthrobotrys flagrans]